MKYLLRWSLFSLAFVPLLVNFDTLFPFIFTKTLLIRAAITLFWILFAVWFFTNRKEANASINNNWRYFKNPLYILTGAFILLMLFSTVFAVDITKAFFGDIERGEGYLGILHFYSFFVASLLVFRKEDWATFFRFNLVTGAILLVDGIGELGEGVFIRAQSFVGNPTFLAGYFLFVTLSAFVSYYLSKNRIEWRIFSFFMIFGGVIGVFLTGTRGAIVGLLAGIAVVVLYFAIKGRDLIIKIPGAKLDLQKVGITLLVLGILGLGLFLLTKDNPFWEKVPGVDRFITITLDDPTVQTRLISAGVSINSIKPADNGALRFLVGYGWDNFNVAYNKYFNPEYMRYEGLWFDRAHNKLLDVLVMTGVLGFIAYMGAWLAVFYLVFKRVREKALAAPLIFFATAYFVQNLFVFDQISTYIPFYAFLAFTVFISSGSGDVELGARLTRLKKLAEKTTPFKLPVVAALFTFAFFAYTIIPYSQSIEFIEMLKLQSSSVEETIEKADSFSEPYTYAQATIRNRLLSSAMSQIGNPGAVDWVNKAMALHEEFIAKEPHDPRDMTLIGTAYRLRGNLGEPGAYEKAEEYFKKSFELSPTRQDHLYNLGVLAADMGDFVAMQEYAGKMLEMSPDVPRTQILYATLITVEGPSRYAEAVGILNTAIRDKYSRLLDPEIATLKNVYERYVNYFQGAKDGENYIVALEGARDLQIILEERQGNINSAESTRIQGIIDSFLTNGWPN